MRDLLATGLSGLAALERTPLAPPSTDPADDVVPIDELLYRGRDALAVALELGSRLRNASASPDAATIAELYDLLQLASAD